MFSCPATPPVASPRGDRPRYEIHVDVHPGFRVVDGTLRVRFTPNRDTKRIVFRLWPNGARALSGGSRLEVSNVTVDGTARAESHPDPTTLVLHATLQARDAVTIRLRWRLRVPANALDRIGRWSSGLRLGTFFPLLPWDPLRGWVTDPPARILAETSTAPSADFDVFVNAPHGLRTFVTGTQVGRNHWHARAVRDLGLAVGKFATATGTAHAPDPVTVRVGIAAHAQVARDVLRSAIRALERLSQRYGAYRWRTYTLVATPDLSEVGIEYPTFVFLGGGGFIQLIIEHETAHQWFYSLVGNDQARDPWLDEALATWGQLQLGGGLPPHLRALAPPHHVGASVAFFGTNSQRYFREVYGGGVQALASLGAPARIDCALKRYAAQNAYAIAQPRNLLAALDSIIPGAGRRLRRFGIRP